MRFWVAPPPNILNLPAGLQKRKKFVQNNSNFNLSSGAHEYYRSLSLRANKKIQPISCFDLIVNQKLG